MNEPFLSGNGIELYHRPTPAVATLLFQEHQGVFYPLLAGREG